jgi:hypothetical protein
MKPSMSSMRCLTARPAVVPRRRTSKYLRGVLGARAVVKEAWLAACLAQQGPVDEEPFLVCWAA